MKDSEARQNGEVEKRSEQRQRTLKSAKAVYNGGHSVLDCSIRNLSDSGAKLETMDPADLPESFVLLFQDGRKRPVEMIWQTANRFGVRFVDSATRKSADEHATVIKQSFVTKILDIERQLAVLRNEMMIHIKD